MSNNVCVMLSTYNGLEYVDAQIESILKQDHSEFTLLIRDDGSTDSTSNCIKGYCKDSKINFIQGYNIGWRRSFLELIYNSPDADYYAFCDQDDIWLPRKLRVAIEKLNTMSIGLPNLYCSNLRYYKDGQDLGLVKHKEPKLTLQLSLMRSLAAGCTMVFNKELRDLIKNHPPERVTAHDFWTYQVATLLGNVYYDMNSYILYRQHSNNQIGASMSKVDIWKKRFDSAKKNFFNNDRQYAAKELLRLYGSMISLEKKQTVEKVAYYDRSFTSRLTLFFDKDFTMGSFANNIWLRVKILFGKI